MSVGGFFDPFLSGILLFPFPVGSDGSSKTTNSTSMTMSGLMSVSGTSNGVSPVGSSGSEMKNHPLGVGDNLLRGTYFRRIPVLSDGSWIG